MGAGGTLARFGCVGNSIQSFCNNTYVISTINSPDMTRVDLSCPRSDEEQHTGNKKKKISNGEVR
ncbi:hypothetical protein E2C01_057770 [Portunus trituberculatus]|uniref:Uncharacterized protein n=1 Tax=Portunus trituberculatus TaxID=210409 RepID=A0A5B7H197_PORTR|nr:hypothetical protein [Portunus trituberculatus]